MTVLRSGPPVTGSGAPGSNGHLSELDRFVEALSPAVMGPRLADALGTTTRTCHVLDAKYEPGLRAVVLYSLGGRLVRGDLVDGEAPTRRQPSTPIVQPGLRLHPFPHDPDLEHLPLLMDGPQVGPLLAEATAASDQVRSRRCRARLLRYRPGKRATVLLTWGSRTIEPLVVKCYHRAEKATAVSEETALLWAEAEATRRLRFARTMAHVPEMALVAQQRVDGTPLATVVGNTHCRPGPVEQAAVRVAAGALAEMHSLPVVSRRARPVEKEIERFAVRPERVGWVDPLLGQALRELCALLIDVGKDIPPDRVGLVHGDCKPSQFLLGPDGVTLLDLDHCGVAEQASDAGTFLASLRQRGVQSALARRAASAGDGFELLAAQFLQEYGRCRGGEDVDARTRWHEAVALERKALRAFARSPRSPLPRALVAQARSCLDRIQEP